jgi:hypothetical protein
MVARMQFNRQKIAAILFDFFEAAPLITVRKLEELSKTPLAEGKLRRTDIPVDFHTHGTPPL